MNKHACLWGNTERMVVKQKHNSCVKWGEREREHTFDVVHLFESSSTLDVPAFWDGLFDTDWDSKAALARSLSFASREANSSSNSPGCIASLEADELTLKMDSRQSLATSRASGSTPGANSTALKTWLFNVRKMNGKKIKLAKPRATHVLQSF